MFETMIDRAERAARSRAEARRGEIAERLRAGLPRGIRVEAVEEGVRLSGRGLAARILLDPRLRALFGEVLR